MAYLEELLEVGQELRLNPYVTQMEKLSDSLKYLTKVFRDKSESQESHHLEEYHVEMIVNHLKGTVCNSCREGVYCQTQSDEVLNTFVRELYAETEEYGAELSIRKKRELEKKCKDFELLKEEILKSIWTVKNNRIWEARMAQSQGASLVAMQAFVNAVEESTKEIDASLFQDERLEKRIGTSLKKLGVRTLKVSLFVSREGRYEVQISAKVKKDSYVTTNQMARVISGVIGRVMIPEKKERLVLKELYGTIVFIEKASFQIMCSVCQQKKEGSEVSGDNFLLTGDIGGKVYAIISDGMGSGRSAYRKSKLLLELAEKLLESGISPKLMVQMMNAALISEVRELEFATLDMCMIDIYRGEVEFLKAGASTTYIVTKRGCKCYQASSLPIGVLVDSEINHYHYPVDKECYVVMVTDGVNEAIAEEKQGFIHSVFAGAQTKNSKELAQKLLDAVLKQSGGIAKDDMMVMVLGVWELQF